MRALVVATLALVLGACAVSAQYDPNRAWSAIHYAKTAYCPASAIQSWSCGPACDFHSSFRVAGVYNNASVASQAYTGYDEATGRIVLAIRGSSNIPNWISDLDFFKTPYPNPDCGCEVHRGFLGEWMSLVGPAMSDINSLYQRYNAPVFVVGHSLGAAVTILAAMDIITHITSDVTVYNFGEPRVGDSKWAAWAASRLPAGKQFRVTHERDPVPHVPPMSFGFLHAPHELWYNNDGNTTWKDCNDSPTAEDPDCSDSEIPYGIDNHLLYLGICTECECTQEHLAKKYGPIRAAKLVARMNAAAQQKSVEKKN